MTNNNLKSFEECALNVKYAYDNTQRQFDEHPPNDDIAPIAAAPSTVGRLYAVVTWALSRR